MRIPKALAVVSVLSFTALLLGIPAVASAATVTLAAVAADRGADAFPADGDVDFLFGNDNAITINAPPSDSMLSSEERGGVEFALAGIPSGATISAATLFLTLSPGDIPAGDVAQVHGYSGNGVIDIADLNVANLVGSFSGALAGDTTFGVAIDPGFVQSLLDGSSGFAGFMVRGVGTAGNAVIFTFWGTSFTLPPEDRPPAPELQIEFEQAVPEPASWLLLATGLAIARSRRGRAARGDT
jgi:hypothetical protein